MAIRHVVMLRRLPGVSAEEASDLTGRLDALGSQVAGLSQWRLVANEHDRPLCWDHLLDAELEDADALAAYLGHPAHQALLPDLRAHFELAVVDYDVGSPS